MTDSEQEAAAGGGRLFEFIGRSSSASMGRVLLPAPDPPPHHPVGFGEDEPQFLDCVYQLRLLF
jgi:hypothetical protein